MTTQTTISINWGTDRISLRSDDQAGNAAALLALVGQAVDFADPRGVPDVRWFWNEDDWHAMRLERGQLTRRRPRPFYSPASHLVCLPPDVTHTVARGFTHPADLIGIVSALHEFIHGARYATLGTLRQHLVEGLTEGLARHLACARIAAPRMLSREEINAILSGIPALDDSVQAVETLAALTQGASALDWLYRLARSAQPQRALTRAVASLLPSTKRRSLAVSISRIPTMLHRLLRQVMEQRGVRVELGEVWYPQGVNQRYALDSA